MSVRHFCTYFDHNYLPRGMVMLESLREHCPHAHVHVLCLSDQCHAALTSLAYPHVSLIRLADLEAADPELAATRATRSLIEYYFTITPCLPWYLLTRDKPLEEVTYLDADMMFFSSPEPIFEEATGASVIITPHRFSQNIKDKECYGLYNVSWLTFHRTENGMACLGWYRNACLNWCKDILDESRFADQKYLNFFPEGFSQVHIMQHSGGGVAPWNLRDSSITKDDTGPCINNLPIVFYHAHGFKRLIGPFFSSGLANYATTVSSKELLFFLKKYARALTFAEKKIRGLFNELKLNGIRGNTKNSWFSLIKKVIYEYKYKTLIISR